MYFESENMKMTAEQIQQKIKFIDIRINNLRAKGETKNAALIKKQLRKRRALEAQL